MKLVGILFARRPLVAALVVVLLVGTTYADWATGPELSLTIFYVAPVALAALLGLWQGVAVALLATAGWFAADALANATYAHPAIPYWNTLVQLLLYALIVFFVSAIQRARLMQQELSEFIVHDLRSPLTAVRAALSSCSGSCEVADSPAHAVLRAGTNSLDRIARMIDDLLDVARAEGGRLKVSPEPLQAAQLVATAVEQMRPWATDLGVTVETAVAPDLPPLIADASLSLRVLINLLSNAIKYTPSGASVTVSASSAEARHVTLAVTDHGPGVPRQWQKRVFGKFEQVEARKSGAAIGTGLGLSFCKLAVAAQGGRIWIESEPDVRTVVSFELPAG